MDLIKNIFSKISAQAKQDHVQVELLISGSESLKLGYQKRQLEKFEASQSNMAGVRVLMGSVQGVSYTEKVDEEALLRTYKDAYENAKMLAAGKSGASDEPLSLVSEQTELADLSQLYQVEDISMDDKKAKARLLEEVCLQADPRVQAVPYNGMTETVSWFRVLNSQGLDREFKQKYWAGHSYVLAKEGEYSKMNGEGLIARRFQDLDFEKSAKEAVRKTVAMLGAEKLKTGHYPVVIDRDCMTSFIMMMEGYFSAKQVHEKRSLLGDKLGQKIAVDDFELIDDPLDPAGLAVRPFDSEGATSRVTPLITQGVLRNFITNLEYAKKMNLPHTAHAARSPASGMGISVSTLKLQKGKATLEQMLSRYPRVLYITKIAGGMHAGFKETTGDFSLPCEGFLIENGQRKPVDQFVLSGNVLDLIQQIEMIGNEWNKPGQSIYAPDVLVKNLSVAGA